jgi:hypothetical protein
VSPVKSVNRIDKRIIETQREKIISQLFTML